MNIDEAKAAIKRWEDKNIIKSLDDLGRYLTGQGFLEGREAGIKEAADIAMAHGVGKDSQFMWKECGADIAKKILDLLEQKP